MCADNELVRVGFMSPVDAEAYIKTLSTYGLEFLVDGKARDLAVVDQLKGPLAPCDWIECGRIDLDNDPKQQVTACRLRGSTQKVIVWPEEWTFEESLSASYGFVPIEATDKSLTFLRSEDGLDVYRNAMTGKEVFVGRSGREPRIHPHFTARLTDT